MNSTRNSVLALIPARGGSKGIPRKNIKKVHGKPLIWYTIESALRSDNIDKTIVTTDDEEIANISEDLGANVPFIRPSDLAEDETPTEPVVSHAVQELKSEFETIVLLQPTSPLRTATDIDKAIEKFDTADADSLVSVFEDHSYRWRQTEDGAQQINYGGDRSRRQEKEPEFVENGAIYITYTGQFTNTNSLKSGRTTLYKMSEIRSIDVDVPEDLKLVEALLKTNF